MFMQGRTTVAAAQYRKAVALLSGCAIAVLLLSGCGGSVWAASEKPATPAVTAQGGWVNAGDVTVTPAATATAGDQGQALTPTEVATEVAPEASATAMPAGDAVQFAGTVENLPSTGDWTGNWQVAGRLIHVDATTTIDQRQGQVAKGARVAIEGWARPDNSVDAGWITVLGPNGTAATATPAASATATPAPSATATPMIGSASPSAGEADQQAASGSEADREAPAGHPVTFRATVQQLPGQGLVGTWIVGGRAVHVNSKTRLQPQFGPFVVGAYVQIHGWLQADGSVNAAWIQVKKPTPVGAGEGINGGNDNNGNTRNNGNNGNNGNKGKGRGNAGRGNAGKGNGGGDGGGD